MTPEEQKVLLIRIDERTKAMAEDIEKLKRKGWDVIKYFGALLIAGVAGGSGVAGIQSIIGG